MAKEKSLVEEAILQMKTLEEAVAENAKGILASTMKEEIKELVKESLNEEEDEDEIDLDKEPDDSEIEEPDMMDMGSEMEDDGEEPPIDLTNHSNDEVLRVFGLMGPDDQIMVAKDDAGNINFKTGDNEYMIVGEGETETYVEDYGNLEEEEGMPTDMSGMSEMFDGEDADYGDFTIGDEGDEGDEEDNEEGDEFDSMNIEDIVSEMFDDGGEEMPIHGDDNIYELELEDVDSETGIFDPSMSIDEPMTEEPLYEISFGGEDNEEDGALYGEEDGALYGEEDGALYGEEDGALYGEEDGALYGEGGNYLDESKKMTFKAKGKVGKGPKFSYKTGKEGGFKTVKKNADKTMGTGNAKKVNVYKDKETLDGEFKIKPKKMETKEASRSLGSGRDFRDGGLPKRRAHSKFNTAIKEERSLEELQILREKNEEYRKALNVFRNKLNEVAVFNSNLAYATRLFTEHSTSKQEKINILRRFDGVESLKESKNLYKIIKDELSGTQSQPMNESIERKIEKAPSTGSAVSLIESKTYENPQFLRMKDLMAKIK